MDIKIKLFEKRKTDIELVFSKLQVKIITLNNSNMKENLVKNLSNAEMKQLIYLQNKILNSQNESIDNKEKDKNDKNDVKNNKDNKESTNNKDNDKDNKIKSLEETKDLHPEKIEHNKKSKQNYT